MKMLYFAIIREKLGKEEEEIEFSGTVAQLRELLIERYRELEPIIRVCRFAVNEEYAEEERFLEGKERVALIPPVSGG